MRKVLWLSCFLTVLVTNAQVKPKPKTKPINHQIKLVPSAKMSDENYSGCELLLRDGIFNFFNSTSSHYSYDEWHNAWCSGTIVNTSSSGSSRAGLDIGVAVISLGMSTDEANSFQQLYKSLYCSSSSRTDQDLSQNAVIKKVVDPNVLTAYVECKKGYQNGLISDVTTSPDMKFITVSMRYRTDFEHPDRKPLVRSVTILPRDASVTTSGILKDGVGLDANTKGLVVQRNDSKPIQIFINTDLGVFQKYLPPVIPPPTDQERIMAALPKGTILGWDNPNSIPAGWVVCDGQNGTPDLNGRVPLGTVKNDVGTRAGNENHSHTISGSTGGATWNEPGDFNGQNIGPLEKYGEHRVFHHHDLTGTSSVEPNMPPATRIMFIMKL